MKIYNNLRFLIVLVFVLGFGLNYALERFAPNALPIWRIGIIVLTVLAIIFLNWRRRQG
jgi:hypothetical protein